MRSVSVDLITQTKSQTPTGYESIIETKTSVFAFVESAKRSEFYEALKAGHKITIVFVLRKSSYDKQTFVEYDGARYYVVRTYQKDIDFIELNCDEVVT